MPPGGEELFITGVPSAGVSVDSATEAGLPIRMLHDRVLVRQDGGEGERRSSAGIVIPATATMGRRLSWATAVGVGPNVRSVVVGDRVLFDPDDRSEVELHGKDYVMLRERDVHAVAATRVSSDGTGLYL
jgi:chaperonin GroES